MSQVVNGLLEVIDGDEKLRKQMLRNLGFMNAELLAEMPDEERVATIQKCIIEMIDQIGSQAERAAIILDRLRE
jgi:hypothetical protein